MTKICNHCKIEKELTEFYKNKKAKYGVHVECKLCSCIRTKAYNSANKKKRSEYIKQWRADNAEHVQQYNKKYLVGYYIENKEDLIKRTTAYKTQRRRTDPTYRLLCNLRRRLSHVLRGTIKSGSAVQDLGCSPEELRSYIESKWESWMTWDNYGTQEGQWSIDHIIPLSSVDLSNREQFLKVNHFTNLRPLLHRTNIIKSNKTR